VRQALQAGMRHAPHVIDRPPLWLLACHDTCSSQEITQSRKDVLSLEKSYR
jgi:hypothetical protein